jgi:glycosyltransferase involved in cell wall biosynthesis
MNVLYLTYDGLTDPLGQSQVLPYVFGLSKHGYNFTLISFEKSENDYNHIQQLVDSESVKWIPLRYTKNPPLFSTLYDIQRLKSEVHQLIKEGRLDMIHCRSHITAMVGLWAKKKFNIPFIFDMRGFWADERIDGNIWDKKNLLHRIGYNYLKRKEREFLELTDYCISLTQSGKDEMLSWNLKVDNPIEVIPCCADENLFNVRNVESGFREELNIEPEDLVITYLGSIGTWYMLEEMLDFFLVLLEENPNSKFLFISKDNKNEIIQKAKLKGINADKILVRPADRKDVPKLLAIGNFSIFFIKPLYSKKASSPTKMGEIMNLGIPVICNGNVGDVDLIMSECLPELLVSDFSTPIYQRIVKSMLHSKFDKSKIIATSKKYYSLEEGVKKYLAVYNSIQK